VGARANQTDFLATDPATEHALVWDLTKSWDLAPLGSLETLEVIEEQVVIADI